MTKTLTSKKILALVLALAMAFSVMAVSAYAASDEVGVPIDPDEQLWYTDNTFALTSMFEQTLIIDDEPDYFILGYNTIQEVVHKDGYYYLTVHPQYFPEYDEYETADYVMEFNSITVMNTDGHYVECLDGGIAKIPEAYALPIGSQIYLKCIVLSTILNVETNEEIPASWNNLEAYFAIPANA